MGIERGARPFGKGLSPRAPLVQTEGAPAIRRAGPGDLDAIIALRLRFERITRDSGSMDETARAMEIGGLLGPDLESGGLLCWLAEADGAAVGQAALRLLGPSLGELLNVYVDPGFRRRGLGSALVGKALDEARSLGLRRITLSETEDSRRIYERAGFRGEEGGMVLSLRPGA